MQYGTSTTLKKRNLNVMYSVEIRAWTATEDPDDSTDVDLTCEEDMELLVDAVRTFMN